MIIDSRYEVIERMGTGLWATVYKVQDIRTGNIYALKLFHKLDSESFYERFSAEDMHHITKLEHPNLLQVVNFGNMGKHIYYLSEFCGGRSLSTFKFKKYNIELLYDIIVQICYALNALHLQDIVHKDLKPENIMYNIVRNKPVVKVLDFGFAKIDFQKSQQTISGSLPYVAPEIYLGKGAQFASDYYSLGVTLYKITTGMHPFSVEQITNLIQGNQQTFIPKFPRELNRDIPPQLEKFILTLLEKNPSDRYPDIESIISYINRIQLKTYPFSQRRSAVTMLKFRSYFVRETHAHQLLDYIPLISAGNGKLVVVIGGDGIGKNNMLSLFRYHLLTDDFFIFDYECSATNKDPFFALVKEFYFSMTTNEKLSADLKNISEKMRKYLFESEESAENVSENKDELKIDFNSTRNFLFHLSEEKPLIYIIRAGQFLTRETIDFVNSISKDMIERKILFIISVDDPSKVNGLIHSIQFRIEPFSKQQTIEYVQKLVQTKVPEDFAEFIWKRTSGIPVFIRDILIDLTEKKDIWKRGKFHLDQVSQDYELPKHLLHSVFNRMGHLTQEVYSYLQKLSVLQTPISKPLAQMILDIDEKTFFFMIHDALNNEVLVVRDEYYYFAFDESQKRLREECDKKTVKAISKKVLEFFDDKEITQVSICRGVIKNAILADNYSAVRKYKLRLIKIYNRYYMQDEAFNEISEVISIDFSEKVKLSRKDIMHDLSVFSEKAELTGLIQKALERIESIDDLPDIFEKYYIRGSFYVALDKYQSAREQFEIALNKSITGKQRMMAVIGIIWSSFRLSDLETSTQYLQMYDSVFMTPDLRVWFMDRKALVMGSSGRPNEAITMVEEFISSLEMNDDTNFLVRLGSLYNNLAFLYISQKSIEEANKNFHKAREIWEKVNYVRSLGLVYNNIGDLALRQGDTQTAFEYFTQALDICEKVDQKRGQVLAFVNFGEAYIKIGEFQKAEASLNRAKKINAEIESVEYTDSINNNLALAKSKIKGFGHFYRFIEHTCPELIEGKIENFNPLVKSYFYYLYQIGNVSHINQIIQNNTFLDFEKLHEEEFQYHLIGLRFMIVGNWKEALVNLHKAKSYSERNKSAFAQAILNIREAECYIGLKMAEDASNALDRAQVMAEKHSFSYWQNAVDVFRCDVDLLISSIPLRKVLRNLLLLLEKARGRELFLMEIAILKRLCKIYAELKAESRTRDYLKQLHEAVNNAVDGLPEGDARLFHLNTFSDQKEDGEVKSVYIESRKRFFKDGWQEMLYDLFKLNEIDRMKFFIDKTITNLLAPASYAIVLSEDWQNRGKPFLSYNMDEEYLFGTDLDPIVDKAVAENRIISRFINGAHTVIVPLRIRSTHVGCFIIADEGEMEFKGIEMRMVKALKLHLTSILMRIKEYGELSQKMSMLQQLMQVEQELFSIYDINKLETEIVSFAINFTRYSRGFLIKKDEYGNYVYQVAMDDKNQILSEWVNISKTLLSEVQMTKEPIFTINAMVDNTFKNSISVQDYQLHSIYCAPIYVDNELHGFLYLDNYNSSRKELPLNKDFMRILLIQISIALKNAKQYDALMKKNLELHTLDTVKDNFIAIVSHELNTPLVSLQGYVNRLRKEIDWKDDEQSKNLSRVEDSVHKLLSTTKDIVTLNKYSMISSIPKEPTEIKPLMEEIAKKAELVSIKRHMNIQLEIPEDLPRVELNWEACDLMVYNLVLNSIRFTKDFGKIVIGARHSAFPREKIDDRPSIVFYVQDNGMGIPAHEQENIFKKFYEVNDLWSHKSGFVEYRSSGLGLGLATTKRISELHDGKIWLKSKEGEGTTVFIAIPLAGSKRIVKGK